MNVVVALSASLHYHVSRFTKQKMSLSLVLRGANTWNVLSVSSKPILTLVRMELASNSSEQQTASGPA